jgi:hypothetical protein
MLEIVSKNPKDISTYFVSNKEHEGHDDKNNSQLSRTNNFNSTDQSRRQATFFRPGLACRNFSLPGFRRG